MTMPTNTGENPTDLDELILLKNKATIPAFESIILSCRTRHTMMMGYKLHVRTHSTYQLGNQLGNQYLKCLNEQLTSFDLHLS